jgi:hypothetical protein
MEEAKNTYHTKFWLENLRGKRALERQRRRGEDGITKYVTSDTRSGKYEDYSLPVYDAV